jgi:hypothetical protein
MSTIKASGLIGVQPQGLDELNKMLRRLGGKEFQAELRKANKDIASEVADDAANIAYGLGGVAAHVAPSIAASAGFTSAGVSLGGSAYPMAAGAEFGGGARPTTQQFKPWRGSGSGAGYFVYEAIRRNAPDIGERFAEAADAILKSHRVTSL